MALSKTKFKLISSNHNEGGVDYKKGDVIESVLPLSEMHFGKFVIVGSDEEAKADLPAPEKVTAPAQAPANPIKGAKKAPTPKKKKK